MTDLSEIENMSSAKRQKVLKKLLKDKTPEERLALIEYYEALLGGKEFSPEGFFLFYKALHGRKIPEHAKKWIYNIFGAKANGKMSLIFSWRGSWKTVTISATFIAYFIGHHPESSNLIVQANDQSAADTAQMIAGYIEINPAWKIVFPNVVPDKQLGWAENGYEVKDTNYEYEVWRAMNAARRDPTLVGLGIRSRSLIGKHPTGMMLLDDIHDEENTSSMRERNNVIKKLTDTLFPFIVHEEGASRKMITWTVAVGTPWHDEDAYHYMNRTGEFDFVEIPMMREAEPGEDCIHIGKDDMTMVDHVDIYGDWIVEWPGMFDVPAIVSARNRTGKRGFWRMYMLDLSKAKETGMKYQLYPSDKIDRNWIASAGVDYASTMEIRGRNIDPRSRSRFALCIGFKTPMNTAVVYDGISEHKTQLEAENQTVMVQEMFPSFLTTGVEMNGVGAQFYNLLARHPGIKMLPFWTGRESKKDRQEIELAPWLELGIILVSDADTDFLNRLRKALDDWPEGSMDEIDSLVAYRKTIPDVCIIRNEDLDAANLPAGRSSNRKKKKVNPFEELAKMKR